MNDRIVTRIKQMVIRKEEYLQPWLPTC